MRLSELDLENTAISLIKKAETRLPTGVKKRIKQALAEEKKPTAKTQLSNILENIRLAEKLQKPMCQDTGVPLFFAKIGSETTLDLNLEKVLEKAVARATRLVPLRPNVVDPFSRKNTGNNTGENMPHVNYEIVWGKDFFELWVVPKGVGSENMSALKMLKPSEGVEGVVDFVVSTVVEAKGKPCPPVFVGVGVGGSLEISSELAKKALLCPDKKENSLEQKIMEKINQKGAGPMGLGGKTTCLGVKILSAGTHTGGLPVAVNIQCWANRKAGVRITKKGRKWL